MKLFKPNIFCYFKKHKKETKEIYIATSGTQVIQTVCTRCGKLLDEERFQ